MEILVAVLPALITGIVLLISTWFPGRYSESRSNQIRSLADAYKQLDSESNAAQSILRLIEELAAPTESTETVKRRTDDVAWALAVATLGGVISAVLVASAEWLPPKVPRGIPVTAGLILLLVSMIVAVYLAVRGMEWTANEPVKKPKEKQEETSISDE